MIRAALEATSICKPVHTGIQKYILDLLNALADAAAADPEFRLTALYKLSHREHAAQRVIASAIRNRWYFGNGFPVMARYDIAHALDMRAPVAPGARLITTVYDLAVFHPDHQFDAYATKRFRNRKHARYQRLLARSAAVVTISQSTRQDIVSLFQYPADRVHVIYPGLSTRLLGPADDRLSNSVLRRHKLKPKKYLFFLGPPNERKNADRLIDAFMKSAASSQFQLVLSGNPAYTSESIRLRLENRTISKRVRFIGYARDEELRPLYENARAFVFPTLYEGFGLPILEALYCGVPVLIANRGAAPEVGGDLALQVDPFSIDAIAEGIDSLTRNTRFDPDEARAWAESFHWANAAASHLELYRKVSEMN